LPEPYRVGSGVTYSRKNGGHHLKSGNHSQ
jgi:hypothetical protein